MRGIPVERIAAEIGGSGGAKSSIASPEEVPQDASGLAVGVLLDLAVAGGGLRAVLGDACEFQRE